jgi:ribosome-associated protein
LAGKTSLGDAMIVASGRSQRHVGAIADKLIERLKEEGVRDTRVEGMPLCDWVLIDAGDVIVHIFRPEAREFYNLEKMWGSERPKREEAAG